jgi:hypothetical protein
VSPQRDNPVDGRRRPAVPAGFDGSGSIHAGSRNDPPIDDDGVLDGVGPTTRAARPDDDGPSASALPLASVSGWG